MFIGAYWGKRQESRIHCAKRIADILQRLRMAHPSLGTWYLKARSRSEALCNSIELSPDTIGRILETNDRNSNGSSIAELGFSIGVWNGNNELPATFSAECGAFSDFVGNSAVLNFDPSWDDDDLLSSERMRGLLVAFVEVFEPDVAVVTSNEYIDRAGGGSPWESGGWLVYERDRGIDQIVETGTIGQVD